MGSGKELKPEERLIVAADFKPKDCGGISGVKKRVLQLAENLAGLGVVIKVNSILRACGYGLISELHDMGLKVFADLKLIDIPETMSIDAELLCEFKPDILTVMCCAEVDGMMAVQKNIGAGCEVLGVTVLTSLNEELCQLIFSCSTKAGVIKLARLARLSGLGGLIMSGQELEVVGKRQELMLLSRNTPGIRPKWSLVPDDDQSRIVTPSKAIMNGADRIVIGRPITQAEDPRKAVQRTLEEIVQACEQLSQKLA